MKKSFLGRVTLALSTILVASNPGYSADLDWQIVVNNGVTIPGSASTFNSYNQPSVNTRGLVVFRARSRGGSGGGAHGVFARDMSVRTPVITIFDGNTVVPCPNNLETTFVEPPSFPRIDLQADTMASRGNHQPVWEYQVSADKVTRAGTTGVYTRLYGNLITGASKLGVVPEFFFYAVPGTVGIPFDVFPGAPAVTDRATIVSTKGKSYRMRRRGA